MSDMSGRAALNVALRHLSTARELADRAPHVVGHNRKKIVERIDAAMAALGQLGRRFKENPGELLTFGANPGPSKGAKLLGRIVSVRYLHETEGPREHRFHEDENIELLRDGSFRVYHPDGARLWKNLK